MIRAALGAIAHRSGQILGSDPRPRVLTWTVTFRCNARCSMCDSWKKDASRELDTARALDLVRTLPRSIGVVRMTGGEPFVRKDLPILVDEVSRTLRPDLLHITTNGFSTEEIVSFLEERVDRGRRRLALLVSLDGTRDSHNRIRGRPFAFDAALATVKAVAARRREWNVDLAVNQTVVDPDGIEQYGELHGLLGSLGVAHHVVVAYAESATYAVAREVDVAPRHPGEFRTVSAFDKSSLEAFFRRLDADLAELPPANRLAKRYYYAGLRARLLEGRADPNPRCQALSGHLRIFPDGSVPVCQFNSSSVGNLAQEDFRSLWTSPRIQGARGWVRKCPGCWAECEVLPSAALGMGIGAQGRAEDR